MVQRGYVGRRYTSDNNVVRVSARVRRAPGYTAPKACRSVTKLLVSSGAWLSDVRAAAASTTSELYVTVR
jgi:hypothetical protein